MLLVDVDRKESLCEPPNLEYVSMILCYIIFHFNSKRFSGHKKHNMFTMFTSSFFILCCNLSNAKLVNK
jgi:hypothetical protein